MNELTCNGKLPLRSAIVRIGGKSAGQIGVGQLEDQLRLGQITQPKLPQPLQPKPAAETARHQVAGRLGEQHLPAVRGGPHPGTPVDRRVVDIIAPLHPRLPGVQPHPHPQRVPVGQSSVRSRSWQAPAASTAATALGKTAKTLSPSPREVTTTPP